MKKPEYDTELNYASLTKITSDQSDNNIQETPSAEKKGLLCPQCLCPINHTLKKCVKCGYEFDAYIYSRLSFYFGQKKVLQSLLTSFSEFNQRLDEITTEIKREETAIAEKLKEINTELAEKQRKELEGKLETEKEQQTFEPAITPPPVQPQEEDKLEELTGKDEDKQEETFERYVPPPQADSRLLEIKFGQKWLLIIGIIIMIFGVGYFLKYSFEQGWVGPAGRVAMAYLWGAGLLGVSRRLKKKGFDMLSLFLIGGGIATFYFSTFAAFQIYHLFGQMPSFMIMVLITVFSCVLSIYHDTKWLAVLGTVGGFLTPIIISTGQDNLMVLMTYITLLNLGILSITLYKNWGLLKYLGFISTYLLYTGWFSHHYTYTKFWPAIIFLNIFYLIYSFVPIAYQLKQGESEEIKEFAIIVPNAFICFGFSYFMISNRYSLEWVSIASLFYAFIPLLTATYLYKKKPEIFQSFIILISQSALFLIVTIPLIFSKHMITIFWSVQALVILWMGLKLKKRIIINISFFLMSVAAAKFLCYDYVTVFNLTTDYFQSMTFHGGYSHMLLERYATTLTVLTCVAGTALLIKRQTLSEELSSRKEIAIINSVFGVLLFIALNIEVITYFNDYMPKVTFAVISLLWTLFAMGLIILGHLKKNWKMIIVSIILFTISVMKIMLVDVSDINTPGFAVSLIILAVTFLWTASATIMLKIAYKLEKQVLITIGICFFLATLSKLFIIDYIHIFGLSAGSILFGFKKGYQYMIVERFLVDIILLYGIERSAVFLEKISTLTVASTHKGASVLYSMFGISLFLILNFETISFFNYYLPKAAFASVSVLWTLYSIGIILIGFRKNDRVIRMVSLGLFGCTIVKVFLIDMAHISTPYRIVSFIMLGIVLVGASYLYHKFKDRIISAIAEDEKGKERHE